MKLLLLLGFVSVFATCYNRGKYNYYTKVLGYKPIYATETEARKFTYLPQKQPVLRAGNIYTKGSYIFQADIGNGIHIINNFTPSVADRVGFIKLNGVSQISIKGNTLYTDNYDDLVMFDISNINSITEVSRVKGAFPNGKYNGVMAIPPEAGYYECPTYNSFVVGWYKDSVLNQCRN